MAKSFTSLQFALPTLRLLLVVVDGYNRQLSWGNELLLPQDLLPYVPQSRLIRPEEGAAECSQGQCWLPAEDLGKGAAAASVCLHRLDGLDHDRMKISQTQLSVMGFLFSFVFVQRCARGLTI